MTATVEVMVVGGMRMMYRLYVPVEDRSTGLGGILTHMHVNLDGQRAYRFQPHGVSSDTGEPLAGKWIDSAAVICRETMPEPKLPLEILGTDVRDIGSGFSGTVTAIVLHESGCVHATVQPKGRHPKTGGLVDAHDFDIRRLEGPALPRRTPEELAKDREDHPSPSATESFGPKAPSLV